jgi:isoprenylcysteine carboxyl methyltransferase (ICMT) family protein YpbQ
MHTKDIVIILPSLSYFFGLVLLINILKLIEKSYYHPADKKLYKSVERNSLYLFKRVRFLLMVMASYEFYTNGDISITQMFVGLMLIIVGLYLRICAIIALGSYWSYDIRIYRKPKVICCGIYRHFRHPAYIGNIYIPGMFLIGHCYLTTAISVIMITWFYIFRATIENRIKNRSIQNA